MKLSLFKFYFFCLLCFLFKPIHAQETTIRDSFELRTSSIHSTPPQKTPKKRWKAMIPDYQKIQFAGSMGFLSFGTGWEYGKNQWETDVLFGFLPKYEDTRAKLTFTLKQNFIPWRIELDSKLKDWFVEPLTCGLYINSIIDERFWLKEPNVYPSNYYKFSTKLRFHLFIGQRINYRIDKTNKNRYVSLFYELSSCDLYVISAVTNHSLRPRDYLSLSLGLKLHLY